MARYRRDKREIPTHIGTGAPLPRRPISAWLSLRDAYAGMVQASRSRGSSPHGPPLAWDETACLCASTTHCLPHSRAK